MILQILFTKIEKYQLRASATLISSTWTTDNVLEQSSLHYFINPYINVDTFTVLKPALFIE